MSEINILDPNPLILQQNSLELLPSFAEKFQRLMSYYRCAIMEIETKFRVLDLQQSVNQETNPIESIKTRLKHPKSIFEKLQRKGLPLSLEAIEENLFDIAGVRVICSFPQDIYMLADALLQQDDVTLIQRKDYIETPKQNGYRSLHLIVETPIFLQNEKRFMKVEVQLRTIAMDFWASLEHKLRYKKGIENMEHYDQISKKLRACADMSAVLDRQMEAIRNQIEEQ